MKFVPADELKAGMRLAKPIFNKRGVMLYERNSKLTRQGIESIRNFQLIGIYILEPAEPLPPMTEEDREFERFQTMSVFTLKEIMQEIRDGHPPKKLEQLATEIQRLFGRNMGRFTFMQNLRSPEDNVYKHSLNTAILTAAIYGKLVQNNRGGQRCAIIAALLHDIGSLDIPEDIQRKKTAELTDEDYEVIERCREAGYRMVRETCNLDSEILKDISLLYQELKSIRLRNYQESKSRDFQVETLKVAYTFDQMTAMKYGEDPQSDIAAYKFLHHPMHHMDQQVVTALTQAIHIVPVGCTVELSDGSRGIVLTDNPTDILRPFILSFYDNRMYNLADGKVYQAMQIKDVVKTMDNRYVMTDKFEEFKAAIKAAGQSGIVRSVQG